MITEADAKTKWCPFGRPGSYVHGRGEPPKYIFAGNRDGNGKPDDLSMCIASACMAWRWIDDGDRIETEKMDVRKLPGELNPPFSNCPEGFTVKSHDSGGFFYCEREISRQPPRGYCGAFGSPAP